jgi:hypothetical protein
MATVAFESVVTVDPCLLLTTRSVAGPPPADSPIDPVLKAEVVGAPGDDVKVKVLDSMAAATAAAAADFSSSAAVIAASPAAMAAIAFAIAFAAAAFSALNSSREESLSLDDEQVVDTDDLRSNLTAGVRDPDSVLTEWLISGQ